MIYLSQFSLEIENQFVFWPYSVASLWSYAEQQGAADRKSLGKIFYIKQPIDEIIDLLYEPELIGFACYVWNEQYNDSIAKEVKRYWPNCKIVYGGPQVPNVLNEQWQNKSWIDICVHGEGEIPFSQIIGGEDIQTIKGISYCLDNVWHNNGKADRIKRMDLLPSPYLSELDKFVYKPKNNFITNLIFETDRGCPYSCTFCDWGGTTASKIYTTDIDKTLAEIEYAGINQYEMIVLANANFGIFNERDRQIADKIISTKEKYGYPKKLQISWAKNSTDRILELAKLLYDNDVLRSFGMSLQSLNDLTLENIKRRNLEINQFVKKLQECNTLGMSVMIELILGLPGETFMSWCENYIRLMEYENANIENYPCMLLNNSELNQKESLEKFGIQSVSVNATAGRNSYDFEPINIITGTNSMPADDMLAAWKWTWCARLGHTLGVTNKIVMYLKNIDNDFSVKEFYFNWYDYINNGNSILNEKFRESCKFLDLHDYTNFVFDYSYINDIGLHRRKETIEDISNFLFTYYGNDKTIAAEIFDLYYYNPSYSYPRTANGKTVTHQGMGSISDYASYIGLTRKNQGWLCRDI